MGLLDTIRTLHPLCQLERARARLRRRLRPPQPPSAEALRLHAAAVEAGQPSYRDPASGREVFTAAWLGAQGACCELACRHCPWHGPSSSRPQGSSSAQMDTAPPGDSRSSSATQPLDPS